MHKCIFSIWTAVRNALQKLYNCCFKSFMKTKKKKNQSGSLNWFIFESINISFNINRYVFLFILKWYIYSFFFLLVSAYIKISFFFISGDFKRRTLFPIFFFSRQLCYCGKKNRPFFLSKNLKSSTLLAVIFLLIQFL